MAKKSAGRRPKETDATKLYQAMLRRVPRRVYGHGEIVLPPAPSLVDQHTQALRTIFAQYGRAFNKEETAELRRILLEQLEIAWATSPYARVVASYETEQPPSMALSYHIGVQFMTTTDEYDLWVNTREAPLFGEHPDAKVMQLARSLGEPKDVPVLDVGAGTGRNTLPLAREGFPTDAIELTPSLAEILRTDATKEALAVRVFETDATAGVVEIPQDHYQLVVVAEVISHLRDVAQCRALFESAAAALRPGGVLVFNSFLASDNYKPDDVARELSQVFWCALFTRKDIAAAMDGLPFERVSEELVYDFERRNLPEEAWPPTGWFEGWVQGNDLFDLPQGEAPMELRWLVYRKQADS